MSILGKMTGNHWGSSHFPLNTNKATFFNRLITVLPLLHEWIRTNICMQCYIQSTFNPLNHPPQKDTCIFYFCSARSRMAANFAWEYEFSDFMYEILLNGDAIFSTNWMNLINQQHIDNEFNLLNQILF